MQREKNTPEAIEEKEDRTLAERSPISSSHASSSKDQDLPDPVPVSRADLRDFLSAINELKLGARQLVEHPDRNQEDLEAFELSCNEIAGQLRHILGEG